MEIINRLECFYDYSNDKHHNYIYSTDSSSILTCNEDAYFWFSKFIPFESFHLIDWDLFYLPYNNLIFSKRSYQKHSFTRFDKYDFTNVDFSDNRVIKEILVIFQFISAFDSSFEREKDVKKAFDKATNIFYINKLSSYSREQLISFIFLNFDCSKERFYLISNF